jgi:serine acetyltransferase
VTTEFKQKSAEDWVPVGVYVKEGASIGARSVCVAPINIGRWAMIAAGSVVTKNVADFALMAGVPARRIGWVGRTGQKLRQNESDETIFECPETNSKYQQKTSNLLIELDGKQFL